MSELENHAGREADQPTPAATGAPVPLAGGSPSPAAEAAAGRGIEGIRGSWPQRLLAAVTVHPLIRRAVFVVLLCALTIPVYRPGLNRYFIADQVTYFAELRGDRSFAAGMHFWDYSRSRQYNKGDEVLFRPLLFTLLAAENTLFGLDHVKWNIANLVLHLLTIYLLFELLMNLAPWPFAELGALFVAVAYAGLELVLWNHLGGYLLGYSFLLLALLAARKVGMEGPSAYRRWLPVYALAILLSMGFYELAVGVSLLVPVYFWWCLRRRPGAGAPRLPWLAASLLPVLLYAVVYTWRALQAQHLFWGVEALVAPQHGDYQAAPSALVRCGQLLWDWGIRTADPWRNKLGINFGYRMEVGQPLYAWSWVATAFYGTAVALLVLTLRSPASRQRLRREAPFLVLVALTVLGYAGMNSLGRVYTDPVQYYLYLFCALGVVILFAAVDFAGLHKGLQGTAAVGLLALIGFNAAYAHRTSRLIGAVSADAVAYFQALDHFVDAHHGEPDFSFAVQDRPDFLDRSVSVWYGYPSHDTVKRVLPISELLFARYYNEWNSKYRPVLPTSADGRGLSNAEAEARWYRMAAECGDAEGMNNLGKMYEEGQGVAKDETEALQWFRKAVEAGSSMGMGNLGVMYAEGRGVAKDEAKGLQWFRKATECGDAGGMYGLGVMYETGRGVDKDVAQAVRWYRQAAEGGSAAGMFNLGVMYANGRGVAKDVAEAVKWYRRAVEGGFPEGMNNLGVMYENGWGVVKDEAEAVKWYRMAAEGGIAMAMYNLGGMYAEGRGVAKNEAEALKWYRQAAEAGNVQGMGNLAWAYANGQGVAKDVAEAVKWFRRAAALGDENAKQTLRQLDAGPAPGR